MKVRQLAIGIFFSIIFSVIAVRAAYLHVIKNKWLAGKAESQYSKFQVTNGKRGTIYDANHEELAVSLDVTSIGAYPSRMENIREDSVKLGKILGLNQKELRKKLEACKTFTWIKRKIPPKEVNEIKELELEGLEFITEHNRFYPNRELAGQVLGFTGTDEKGLEGLEFQYNSELEAPSDKYQITRDALGRCISTNTGNLSGYTGNNLTLTIDRQIQYITETALKSAAEEYQANSGMAVVMRPQTGALLAIAHYPSFNPNTFGQYSHETRRNRAITDPFEPGSTLKVILASAAIDSNLCNPSSMFYCENGSYRIGSNKVNDTHSYQNLSLLQVVKYSSNIGAVKISEIMGKKLLYNYLTEFGFGRKSGVDCPSETSGILSNYANWTNIDTSTIAFGQGISVSAVQLISAVSAIANGGFMVKPHIVQSVSNPDGTMNREYGKSEPRRVISQATSEKVKEIMASVVTDGGTGVKAALNGYTVCGKTGTAQKIEKNAGYSKHHFTSSFIGFAPKSHPEVTVLVLLDEPKAGHYGGTVAAPAFKKIMYETLNYLNVEPEKDSNEATMMLAQRSEVKQ